MSTRITQMITGLGVLGLVGAWSGTASADLLDLGTLLANAQVASSVNIPDGTSIDEIWQFEVASTLNVSAQLTNVSTPGEAVNITDLNGVLYSGTVTGLGTAVGPTNSVVTANGQVTVAAPNQFLYYANDTLPGSPIALASTGVLGAAPDTVAFAPQYVTLLPGTEYYYEIKGTAGPGVNGGYELNIQTQGVPELSTWAMMLVGFGLVGLQLRRRVGTRSAVTFS
jgi:hypothetical protein